MKLWFVDFETYYTDDYSLKRMTPAEYILDPRFEVIGCAFKEGLSGQPFWLDGPELPRFFAALPHEVGIVSHNALFDSCILAWHYHVVPRLTSCTLSIARATLAHALRSLSLESVAKHLNLGTKGRALIKVKGMGLAQLKALPLLYQEFVDYSLTDVELCAGIFRKLVVSGLFPVQELAVLDMVIRCATQPVFGLQQDVLSEHLSEVIRVKQDVLARAGVEKDLLMSNEHFAEVLRSLGVDPPQKISPTTEKLTYAFAKTDLALLDLLEHENPAVQAVVAARLGVKSTLEETRTTRFLNISRLVTPEGNPLGMPMPLRYSGAHTHRLSGDWLLNVQNLTRGGALRRSLKAPSGYKVVAADASQIEARLTAWFCGCSKLVDQFARGEEVYANFASTVFGFQVDKNVHKVERFCGKTGILSLGFGAGTKKFGNTLAVQSEIQLGTRLTLPDDRVEHIVNTYRREFREIPAMWRFLNDTAIPILAGIYPTQQTLQLGPVVIEKGRIVLPDMLGIVGAGLSIYYDDLVRDERGEWRFTFGGKRKRVYGGKLLENIIQALDRVIVIGAALRCQKLLAPYRLAHQQHDENAYVVRDEHAEPVKRLILNEMQRCPPWALGLPLAAEAGIGSTYGEAK